MAYCVKCGGELPGAAAFCPACGTAQATGAAPAAGTGAVAGGLPGAAAAAGPAETVIFEGSPRLLASVGDLALTIITLGLYLLGRWLVCASQRYKVTSQRIEYETGILSKRRDVLWLYRVEDLVLERPFFQRLMGTGNLQIVSSDKSTPDLRLDGLSGVTPLYEQIKASVERERMRRQVRVVDLQQ
ncbi:MAG: PH domain-containing protein [Planctomycetes bacterium]|nr:PH domain-containing protein [Planctomycetota bacterium]